MPSNLVYSCVQDDKGFLWITTDNGVSRFDGKYFKNYSLTDGVPDNDVLEVVKEKDGTIWINTFKQGPCYYDEKTDRFIDPLKNSDVQRSFVKLVLSSKVLDEGGVVFFNGNGELVFKNKKLVQYAHKINNRINGPAGPYWMYSDLLIKDGKKEYAYLKTKDRTDSLFLFEKKGAQPLYGFSMLLGNKLYVLKGDSTMYILKRTADSKKPFQVTERTIGANPLLIRRSNNDEFLVSTTKGVIYVFDFETDLFKYKISGDFFANSYFKDREGNIWIATVDKGLLLFGNSNITIKKPFPGLSIKNSFRSLFVEKDGAVYGGNNYGDIAELFPGRTVRIRNISSYGNATKVLGILTAQKKVFVFSDWGCMVNYKRFIRLNGSEGLTNLKRGILFNDSIIIAAGVSQLGGLYKINAVTEYATRLNVPLLRISSLESQGKIIYVGTTEGLFQYDYEINRLSEIGAATPLKGLRVLSMAITPDGLLWVSTASSGIFVLKQNQILYHINENQFLNYPGMKLQAFDKTGYVWAITRKGIICIKYKNDDTAFSYNAISINQREGLTTNLINDIFYRNDSVYLATENGIAVMPADIKTPVPDIKTYLVDVKINQKAVPVAAAYQLASSQGTVTLTFSGVNLQGMLDHFVYWLDEDTVPNEIIGNTLNLQLEAGRHKIKVRAVDINKQVSNSELTLIFDREIPYYKRWWFIFLVATLLSGLILFLFYKVKIIKQKRNYEQQQKIENERNRITEDLHDDIGSSLSSLRVYSDVAGKLIEKDAEKARYLLDQISANTSRIMEDIGDIIWSLRPDKHNLFSIDSRIKNFVSEVLGNKEIDYSINIEPGVNETIQHITARKNVVLIVKEAINNVVKYSNASHVTVHLYIKDGALAIEITDNGKGFNEKEVKTGNGLRNMKKRTNELNGSFTLFSKPGNGTRLLVKLPVTNISDKR
ncbi:hypothetical protein A8C56_02360 [Niabella ginsenosidivorans]|uniref:Oxygen sensor histidine kinase NreB n=1 Tax=Niabella ginsenosidivorans TaxID=1176587 RepID=A0A1A9HZS9_9BACT|nr:hypothetical protein A8C56_02360 [Niabella ginsenosidivorans]